MYDFAAKIGVLKQEFKQTILRWKASPEVLQVVEKESRVPGAKITFEEDGGVMVVNVGTAKMYDNKGNKGPCTGRGLTMM
jgi:hypothetical protein